MLSQAAARQADAGKPLGRDSVREYDLAWRGKSERPGLAAGQAAWVLWLRCSDTSSTGLGSEMRRCLASNVKLLFRGANKGRSGQQPVSVGRGVWIVDG